MKGGRAAVLLAVLAALLLPLGGPAAALDQRPRDGRPRDGAVRPERALMPPPSERYDVLSPRARMNVVPADAVDEEGDADEGTAPERTRAGRERRPMKAEPPAQGRRTCIEVDRIAGAQLFGDSAIELTMTNGRHWRMFLADECPGLSFYQGFYYRRGKAGMLCAGRDSIGARSGGECPIASIVPVKPRED